MILRVGFGQDNKHRTAVTTEAGPGRILTAAPWATDIECNTALNAELLTRGVLEVAA